MSWIELRWFSWNERGSGLPITEGARASSWLDPFFRTIEACALNQAISLPPKWQGSMGDAPEENASKTGCSPPSCAFAVPSEPQCGPAGLATQPLQIEAKGPACGT